MKREEPYGGKTRMMMKFSERRDAAKCSVNRR